MSALHARLAATSLCCLLLAACESREPYERTDAWRPTGANALNFELQVARPTDLVLGRGTQDADGNTAAQAVERLRQDKVKRPATSPTSQMGAGPSGGS